LVVWSLIGIGVCQSSGSLHGLTNAIVLAESFKASFINSLFAVTIIGKRGISGAKLFHNHPIRAALCRRRKVLEMQKQPQFKSRV